MRKIISSFVATLHLFWILASTSCSSSCISHAFVHPFSAVVAKTRTTSNNANNAMTRLHYLPLHVEAGNDNHNKEDGTGGATAPPSLSSFEEEQEGVEDETKLQALYQAWTVRHAKTKSKERYNIWKRNYLASQKVHQAAILRAAQESKPVPGPLRLNQFADLTPTEFQHAKQQLSLSSHRPATSRPSTSTLGPNQQITARPPPKQGVSPPSKPTAATPSSSSSDANFFTGDHKRQTPSTHPRTTTTSAKRNGLLSAQTENFSTTSSIPKVQPKGTISTTMDDQDDEDKDIAAVSGELPPAPVKPSNAVGDGFYVPWNALKDVAYGQTESQRIHNLYHHYCTYFDKTVPPSKDANDNSRLVKFAERLFLFLKVQEDTVVVQQRPPLTMNRYADMTVEEFQLAKAHDQKQKQERLQLLQKERHIQTQQDQAAREQGQARQVAWKAQQAQIQAQKAAKEAERQRQMVAEEERMAAELEAIKAQQALQRAKQQEQAQRALLEERQRNDLDLKIQKEKQEALQAKVQQDKARQEAERVALQESMAKAAALRAQAEEATRQAQAEHTKLQAELQQKQQTELTQRALLEASIANTNIDASSSENAAAQTPTLEQIRRQEALEQMMAEKEDRLQEEVRQKAQLEAQRLADLEQARKEVEEKMQMEQAAAAVAAEEEARRIKAEEKEAARLLAEQQAQQKKQQAEEEATRKRLVEEEAKLKAQREAEAQRLAEEAARIKAEQVAEAKRIAAEQEAAAKRLKEEEARLRRQQEEEAKRLAEEAARIKAEQAEEARRLAEERERIVAEKEEAARLLEEEKKQIRVEQEAEAKREALATIKELREMLVKQQQEAETAKQQALRAEEARDELEKLQQNELKIREEERRKLEAKEQERLAEAMQTMEREYTELAAKRAEVEELFQQESKLRIAAEEKQKAEQEAREKALQEASMNAQGIEKARKEAEDVRRAAERETLMREQTEELRKQEETARLELLTAKQELEEQARLAEDRRIAEASAREKAEMTVEEKARELEELRKFERELRKEAEAAKAEAAKAKELAQSEAARRDIEIKAFEEEQVRLESQAKAAREEVEAMKSLAEAESALRAQEILNLRNEIREMVENERKQIEQAAEKALEAQIRQAAEIQRIQVLKELSQRELLAATLENNAKAASLQLKEAQANLERQTLLQQATEQGRLREERKAQDNLRRAIEEDLRLSSAIFARKSADMNLMADSLRNSMAEVDEMAKQQVHNSKKAAEDKLRLEQEETRLQLEREEMERQIAEAAAAEARIEDERARKAKEEQACIDAEQDAARKRKQEVFQRSLLSSKLQNDALTALFAAEERQEMERKAAEAAKQASISAAEKEARVAAEIAIAEEEKATQAEEKRNEATMKESARQSKQELFQRSLLAAKLQNDAVAAVLALDREIAALEEEIRAEKEREIIRLEAELRARENQELQQRRAQRAQVVTKQEMDANLASQKRADDALFQNTLLDSIADVDRLARRQARKTQDDFVSPKASMTQVENQTSVSVDSKSARLSPPEPSEADKSDKDKYSTDTVGKVLADPTTQPDNAAASSTKDEEQANDLAPASSMTNDNIVSEVLSKDFQDEDLAELSFLLDLDGPVSSGGEQQKASPQESAVGNFFNNLSTQVWGVRKSTEKDEEEASAIKEKSLFFLRDEADELTPPTTMADTSVEELPKPTASINFFAVEKAQTTSTISDIEDTGIIAEESEVEETVSEVTDSLETSSYSPPLEGPIVQEAPVTEPAKESKETTISPAVTNPNTEDTLISEAPTSKQVLSAGKFLQSLFPKPGVATKIPSEEASKTPQPPIAEPPMQSFGKAEAEAEELRSRKTIPVPFNLDSIPTLSSWVENTDESITGIINNSPNFASGDEVVTAPIVDRTERVLNFGRKAIIVTTVSGSKYRLVGPGRVTEGGGAGRFKDESPMGMAPGYSFDNEPPQSTESKPSPIAGLNLGSLLRTEKPAAGPIEVEPEEKEAPTKSTGLGANTFGFLGARKTLTIPKSTPTESKGKTSAEPATSSKARPGFPSIFGAGTKVPTLSDWEQNEDGSITGYVSNREGFEDGTLITTSPVEVAAQKGRVVTTTGGSKYKLT